MTRLAGDANLQRYMGHQDPRTTQRYYDHSEVEVLEVALVGVPEVARASELVRRMQEA